MATGFARRDLRRLGAALAVVAAGAFGTAAQAAPLTTVRVADFQNSIALPLYYGVQKGYFRDAGLDIQFVKIASGAASVAAVASGAADIGLSATSVPIFARANGVPVKAFMTADQEGPGHHGTFIDASARSGVTAFNQMKGKTVMINAFGTAGELAIRERLLDAGVAWKDVNKVIVPFPQMPAALQLGNADVAITIQPMQTAIMANKDIGARVLDTGTLSESHKVAVTASCYFATDSWLAKNRDAAIAFGRAYLRAQKEVHADHELRIALVMKVAGMKREVAEQVPESWFEMLAVTKASLGPNYDALVRTGMMAKPFPVDDVIATLPY
ncbi:MAG TPA: ABC transporter substrate-binding protein [Hyphomicrobiales bacterium]|nr:ABC transporter substrate-binding protein [Hyphomicrobiales bacterium]